MSKETIDKLAKNLKTEVGKDALEQSKKAKKEIAAIKNKTRKDQEMKDDEKRGIRFEMKYQNFLKVSANMDVGVRAYDNLSSITLELMKVWIEFTAALVELGLMGKALKGIVSMLKPSDEPPKTIMGQGKKKLYDLIGDAYNSAKSSLQKRGLILPEEAAMPKLSSEIKLDKDNKLVTSIELISQSKNPDTQGQIRKVEQESGIQKAFEAVLVEWMALKGYEFKDRTFKNVTTNVTLTDAEMKKVVNADDGFVAFIKGNTSLQHSLANNQQLDDAPEAPKLK